MQHFQQKEYFYLYALQHLYKLKREYLIPQNTFFQFTIPAHDPEGNRILYKAHQADLDKKYFAKFLAFKPTENNQICFQSIPFDDGFKEFSTPESKGEFTFWLSANDYNPSDTNFKTMYDFYKTKVKIVDGTPFKITTKFNDEYTHNEKITIKWNVDKKIFPPDSKVKISLSDDFGQTFKHVLVQSTPNDGEQEITLPSIEIKEIKYGNFSNVRAGVIKVEVLDNIAYDVSCLKPGVIKNGVFVSTGGFTLSKHTLKFTKLPKPWIIANDDSHLYVKGEVQAETTCVDKTKYLSKSVVPKYEEKTIDRKNTIKIWTAYDDCGNQSTFVQNIKIKENPVPNIINNTENNNPVTPSTNTENNNPVTPNTNTTPENKEIIFFNAVNYPGNRNFLYFKNLEFYPKNKLTIYNELGLIVFKTENYGENGNYFVVNYSYKNINKNQRLLSKIYFYILEYEKTTKLKLFLAI